MAEPQTAGQQTSDDLPLTNSVSLLTTEPSAAHCLSNSRDAARRLSEPGAMGMTIDRHAVKHGSHHVK